MPELASGPFETTSTPKRLLNTALLADDPLTTSERLYFCYMLDGISQRLPTDLHSWKKWYYSETTVMNWGSRAVLIPKSAGNLPLIWLHAESIGWLSGLNKWQTARNACQTIAETYQGFYTDHYGLNLPQGWHHLLSFFRTLNGRAVADLAQYREFWVSALNYYDLTHNLLIKSRYLRQPIPADDSAAIKDATTLYELLEDKLEQLDPDLSAEIVMCLRHSGAEFGSSVIKEENVIGNAIEKLEDSYTLLAEAHQATGERMAFHRLISATVALFPDRLPSNAI